MSQTEIKKGKKRRKAGEREAAGRRRRRRRTPAGRVTTAVLIFLSAVILILLAAAAAIVLLNAHGRSSLQKKQEERPEQMTEMADEPETSDNLPPGAIRYQGKAYLYKEDILTFLCMGIDRKGEVEASDDLFKGGQADSLFLAVLDPDEKRIRIVGINRDTMTEISVYDANGLYAGKEVAQIALAHAYGEGLEESVKRDVEAKLREKGYEKLTWVRTGCVIAAHSGPGAFGIVGFAE